MSRISIAVIAYLILIFHATASNAVVELVGVDVDVNSIPNLNQGTIPIPGGESGQFEILICATPSDSTNAFNNATPGWTTLDSGSCGGSGGCILGIFYRTDDSPDSSLSTCHWADPTTIYGGGSFRYSGVDPADFFIDVECNTGSFGVPTAPSILTSAGSAVVRTFAYGGILETQIVGSNQVEEGNFGFGGSSLGQFIVGSGDSFAFEDTVPTGEYEFDTFVEGDWRACTIAFGPEIDISRPIPTLSEWGMIAAAAGLMIAGVWFAARRRREARA
ncbi:MAG: IPTL-CTERM sorting domain-containing protein [Thermodesulfobacteriota bacterium]